MKCFVTKKGKNLGPFDLEEINKKLSQKEFLPTDMAWIEGMENWTALNDEVFISKGIVIPSEDEPPPIPPEDEPDIKSKVGGAILLKAKEVAEGAQKILGSEKGKAVKNKNPKYWMNLKEEIKSTEKPVIKRTWILVFCSISIIAFLTFFFSNTNSSKDWESAHYVNKIFELQNERRELQNEIRALQKKLSSSTDQSLTISKQNERDTLDSRNQPKFSMPIKSSEEETVSKNSNMVNSYRKERKSRFSWFEDSIEEKIGGLWSCYEIISRTTGVYELHEDGRCISYQRNNSGNVSYLRNRKWKYLGTNNDSHHVVELSDDGRGSQEILMGYFQTELEKRKGVKAAEERILVGETVYSKRKKPL